MGQLFSYSLTGGFIMLVLFLAYRLFMARENQHMFNRSILLLIYFISFAAVPLFALIQTLNVSASLHSFNLHDIENLTYDIIPVEKPIWGTILIWIYIAGMTFVVLKTIFTWHSLLVTIHDGEIIKKDGYTLVLTENERLAPFSWIRYIVINRKDYIEETSVILTHEIRHIKSRHWIDLLSAQIVCIINWFNPAAWLMREELMLIHEYQADMAVIENGFNPKEYQMLLIKKAVGSRFPSLANSLNHSKLKKRITMMYKSKSGVSQRLKALSLVPMLVLAFGMTNMPQVRAALNTISDSDVTIHKSSKNAKQNKIDVTHYVVTNISNDGNETIVSIKTENLGNEITMSDGIFINAGKTYQASLMTYEMNNDSGVIRMIFPFSGQLKKASMSLKINGEEIPFNLENFNNYTVSVKKIKNEDSSGNIKVNKVTARKKSVPSIEIMELPKTKKITIYLDGKKISNDEMKALDPNRIASIDVDKKGSTISIFTKETESKNIDNAIPRINLNSSNLPENTVIYLDGKKITQEEMKALNPEKIASITVDKEGKTISIVSK